MTNYFLSIQQYWEPPGVKVWPLDVEHGLGNQAAVQRSVQEPVPALDSRVGGDTINSIFTVPVSSYNSYIHPMPRWGVFIDTHWVKIIYILDTHHDYWLLWPSVWTDRVAVIPNPSCCFSVCSSLFTKAMLEAYQRGLKPGLVTEPSVLNFTVIVLPVVNAKKR